MIALAIRTKIPMPYWVEWGERAIATGWEVVDDMEDAKRDAMRGLAGG